MGSSGSKNKQKKESNKNEEEKGKDVETTSEEKKQQNSDEDKEKNKQERIKEEERKKEELKQSILRKIKREEIINKIKFSDEEFTNYIIKFFEEFIQLFYSLPKKNAFISLTCEFNKKYVYTFFLKEYPDNPLRDNFFEVFKYSTIIVVCLVFLSKDLDLYKKYVSKIKEPIEKFIYAIINIVGRNYLKSRMINTFMKNFKKVKRGPIFCMNDVIKILFTTGKSSAAYKNLKNALNQIINNITVEPIEKVVTKINESVLFFYNASSYQSQQRSSIATQTKEFKETNTLKKMRTNRTDTRKITKKEEIPNKTPINNIIEKKDEQNINNNLNDNKNNNIQIRPQSAVLINNNRNMNDININNIVNNNNFCIENNNISNINEMNNLTEKMRKLKMKEQDEWAIKAKLDHDNYIKEQNEMKKTLYEKQMKQRELLENQIKEKKEREEKLYNDKRIKLNKQFQNYRRNIGENELNNNLNYIDKNNNNSKNNDMNMNNYMENNNNLVQNQNKNIIQMEKVLLRMKLALKI